MIQVYLPNNTDFEHNGDMVLTPEQAEVTCEINGAWEAILVHPIDEAGRWEALVDGAVIKMPSWNGEQLFRIRVKDKSDLAGITCTCDPIFFDAANDCFLEDVRPTSKTGQQALDIMTAANTKYSGVSNISKVSTAYYEFKNLLEAISGSDDNSFLKRWGGEIEYDNFTVRINTRLGSDKNIEYRYGKNIEGVTETVDMSEVVTRIYPKAFNGRTLSGTKYVDSPLIGAYPTVKSRVMVFDNIKLIDDVQAADSTNPDLTICNTQAELDTALRQACVYQWDAGIDKPLVTIQIEGVVPNMTEFSGADLELGDTVYLRHPVLDITTESRVVALTYDSIRKEVISITLGSVAYNYFNSVSSAVTRIETAVRPDGSVRADAVKGVIDMGQANLYAQYDVATRQDVLGMLFENNDSTSELYGAMAIGTQGFMISKTKDEDGNWIWSTFGTAAGLNANYIIAGTIAATLIAANSISVSKLTGTISNGNWVIDLDNGTLTIGNITASNIYGGTLTLGGANNVNGSMQVLDANGNVIGTWTKDGITITGGRISTTDNNSYWHLTTGHLVIENSSGTGIEMYNGSLNFYYDGVMVANIIPMYYSGYNGSLKLSMQSNSMLQIGSCLFLLTTNSGYEQYTIGKQTTAACVATLSSNDSSNDYALIGYGWGSSDPLTATYIKVNDGQITIRSDSIVLNGTEVSKYPVLDVTTPSFNSLSQTFYHSAITANHKVVSYTLSNPSAQTSDWTISTGPGYFIITGSISGSTTLNVVLAVPVATVTASLTSS